MLIFHYIMEYVGNLSGPCSLHEQPKDEIIWLSLFTGLDYWTGILDWTTGLKFFPFLDKLSIWFLKIFDTWRSQFFLKQS